MFGMDNPGQVIPQLQQYVSGGRLELAEVIASELVEVLLAKKKRDLENQAWLVEAARIACSVFEERGKAKRAWAAAQTLHVQRKKLKAMLVKDENASGLQNLLSLGPDDHILAARAAAGTKKFSKAAKHTKQVQKLVKGHLGGKIVAAQIHMIAKGHMKQATTAILELVMQLDASGPIIRSGGAYQISPDGQNSTDLNWLINNMKYWLNEDAGLTQKATLSLKECLEGLERQMAAIESGEQAANAKLQSAVDSLVPTVDYHSYSRS